MRWRELRGKLAAQPGHDDAVAQELPYRPLALAIARLRGDLDMTQAEFARHVGVPQSVVARAESGRHAPNLKLVERVAGAFDMDWRVSFVHRQAAYDPADAARPVQLDHVLNRALLRLHPRDAELSFAASTTDVLVDLGSSAIENDVTLVSSVVTPRDALPVPRRPVRPADEPARTAELALAS